MNRKEFIENLTEAAGLQYDLWRKFPRYVHMDFTLSTDKDQDKVKYNIYTPEINHNPHAEFNDFVRFMKLLIKDGVRNVNIGLLKTELAEARKRKIDAIDVIAETTAKLEKLDAMGESDG